MEEDDELNHLEPNVRLAVYHLNKLFEIREATGWKEGDFGSFVSESHAYIRELVSNGTIEFKSSDYYSLKDIHEYLLKIAFHKRFLD